MNLERSLELERDEWLRLAEQRLEQLVVDRKQALTWRDLLKKSQERESYLVNVLHNISLASQNSSSTKEGLGKEARDAIALKF